MVFPLVVSVVVPPIFDPSMGTMEPNTLIVRLFAAILYIVLR